MNRAYWGAAAVGVAFWLMVAASAVTAIITDYRKRQAALDTVRGASEHGQQLDPALVETLLSRKKWERTDPRLVAQHVRVGGVITVASGVGVALLAFFIAKIATQAFGGWLRKLSIQRLAAAPDARKAASDTGGVRMSAADRDLDRRLQRLFDLRRQDLAGECVFHAIVNRVSTGW